MNATESHLAFVDQQAEAITEVKRAAENLVTASENLRTCIDALDAQLRRAAELSCQFPEGSITAAMNRSQRIRELRNSMEAFHLKLAIEAAAEKAWAALP